jgi:hypothetical protein
MLLAYPVIMGLRDNSPAVNYKGYRPVTAHDANEREDDTASVPSGEGTPFDTSPSRVAISTSRIRDLENKIKDELVDFFLMFSNSKLSLTFVSILFSTGGGFKDIILPHASITQHWSLAKVNHSRRMYVYSH